MRVKLPPRSTGDHPAPRISVVIPCYNYGRFLPDCVKSALDQPAVAVDVVIIDDASTDGSAEVARRLAEEDSRVQVVQHSRNMGHIATANHCFELVTAEYFTLISADDALAPGALPRATAILEANPSVGFVYGKTKLHYGESTPPPRLAGSQSWTLFDGREWIRWVCRAGRNFILSPEVVMRSSIPRQIGLSHPDLPQSNDMEYWLRAAKVSDVARINGAYQAYYRVHGKNMSQTTFAGAWRELTSRRDAFAVALGGEDDGLLPDRNRLRKVAFRSICRKAMRNAAGAIERQEIDEAQRFMALARDLDPGVELSGRWRYLEHRLAGDGGVAVAARERADRLSKDIRDRAHWYLSQWLGI